MSYCVNCGVELASTAKKCPLCNTPVINPNILMEKESAPPFPDRIVIPKGAGKQFASFIISMLLILPNIICVITNLLMTPHELWSVYVVASSAMAWVLFVLPLLLKKKYKYFILCLDAITTCLYIFLFYYYNSDRTGWFLSLAVPLVVGLFLTIGILVFYFSKKRNMIKTIITALSAVIAYDVFTYLIVNLYKSSVLVTYIAFILATSCAILLVFFLTANYNPRFRAWLSRKFFF